MSANPTLSGICLATLVLGASPAWSGGAGGHGVMIPTGGVSHGGGGFRAGGFNGGMGGGFHGGWGRPGGFHPLPPIAGTIHERRGQPSMTAYGHTNTGFAGPGFHRAGVYDLGRGQAAAYGPQQRWGGYGQQQTWTGYGQQQNWAGYGGQRQVVYGRERMAGYTNGFGRERFGRERTEERAGYRERLRFAELRRARGLAYGGYGGYGNSDYGSGSYDSGDVGSYPAAGTYGNAGSYGGSGNYASAGTYGSAGTYPAPGVYESELDGQGYGYRSETPLAARYAEAPLAPSPYGGFDAGNSYADAASRDVGPGSGPRIIHVSAGTSSCTCDRSARTTPVVYRYGVGTAY